MRTTLLNSARARFAATAATVFALVALGGVTAAPAYAGPAGIRALDAVTGELFYPGGSYVLTNVDTGDQELIVTDPVSGYYTHYIADGNYTLTSGDTAHVPSAVFAIVDGTTYYTIPIDTHKVTGTINSDAGGGLTTASVEYFNGTSWGPVGTNLDSPTISDANGTFVFRAPQGPADYRLRFQPDPSTGYAETVVPFSINGNSSALTDLGAISLNVSRSISGTVYATDGVTPVIGATVTASQSGTYVASTTTNGNGEYTIAVPPTDASYTVTATGTGFFAQEWDASAAGTETVSVNATDGYNRFGVDFALDIEVVSIGGTVLNSNFFGASLLAQLWSGGTATPTLIEEVEVGRPGGEYLFSSVPTSGSYFIKFIASGNDAFIDTLLGDSGYSAWSRDAAADSAFSTDHSFGVSLADPASYEDRDVTIEQGVLFYGNFTGGSNEPVDGCVDVIDLDDPTYSNCVAPSASGTWAVRVPVGHTYTFHAIDNSGEFAGQWFEYAADQASATEVEALYGGYYRIVSFSLAPSPASLYGFVRDVTAADPITVFLYVYFNNQWSEVASHTTTPGVDEVYFDENWFNGYPGLAVGDYRVRFQDSNGMWLAANSHEVGRLPERDGIPASNVTCYLDIDDVVQGRPFYVDATFDAANQDPSQCGPQALDFRTVSGLVLSTPDWASVPVAGHAVTFFNEDDFATGTTNADGTFTVNYVREGTFDVEVYPTAHVLGSHEFTYSGSGFVFNSGNVTLDDTFYATRLGNAYGTISDWDSSMDGAVATVFHLVEDPDGDYWEPGPISQPIVNGDFEVPGIAVDGTYAVRIDFPTTYAPVFLGGGYPTPAAPFTGDGEQDFFVGSIAADPAELVTISGTVFFGSEPLGYAVVIAHPVGSTCECEAFHGQVDEDGNYSIQVAPNFDYEIAVTAQGTGWSPQILDQSYNGHNFDPDDGPTDFDLFTVGSTDMAGPDFSLVASDEVFFDTYTTLWDEATDEVEYTSGVDVHIYKYVVDGWEEVAVVTSDEEAAAYTELLGGGDYRMRFSYNGDWLAVHEQAYGEIYYPYQDTVDTAEVYSPAQCAVDFDDLAAASYVYTEFNLVPDPAVGDCGPEVVAEHYDVFGTTVQSDALGNYPVYGQTVTLTSGTGVVLTDTTDSQGLYDFDGVSPGSYTLAVPSVITGDDHAYVGYSQTVVVDDDEALDPIELTRYGNAEVGIYNWDSSMAGAVAHLEIESSPGVWTAIGLSDVVDAAMFVIPGISVDGDYRIWIDYPAGYVDGYAMDYYDPSAIALLDGYAESDLGGTAVRAFTTVSGTVRLGATAVSGATVTLEAWMGGYEFATVSASDGTYSVAVPAGGTYTAEAVKSGLVRGLITTQAVGYAPQGSVDLAMDFATFFTETFDGTDPLTVHLYRKVTGGWQEVASDTATEVMLWTTLSGDYRLRFSDGADWLAVSEYEIDGAPAVNPVPNVCYIDFAPAVGGSEYELLIEPVTPTAGVTCAAEPTVVTPPTTPPTAPTPGTSGSGTKKPVATFAETTDEELEPTSTPTPTPTPTEDATDQPTDEPTEEADVDKPAAASAPDFTWLFWVSGILVLLVLAGGAVYIIRRRG